MTTDNQKALDACPFCSGKANHLSEFYNGDVQCTGCGAIADAALWNTRQSVTDSGLPLAFLVETVDDKRLLFTYQSAEQLCASYLDTDGKITPLYKYAATAPKNCDAQAGVDALYGYQAGYEEGRKSCDALVKSLEEMIDAAKTGNIDSPTLQHPETGEDCHKWHEEWLCSAEKALAAHRAQGGV